MNGELEILISTEQEEEYLWSQLKANTQTEKCTRPLLLTIVLDSVCQCTNENRTVGCYNHVRQIDHDREILLITVQLDVVFLILMVLSRQKMHRLLRMKTMGIRMKHSAL